MFITPLFIIANLQKQPRCPTNDEQIRKMWYIYTMEFYPAIRKNGTKWFKGKWMQLEDIMFSEVIQV
jgi:hypothetical protein